MKRIATITLICGLAHLAFAQNFGIDQPTPLVKLHVNGNAFFDLPLGGAALENSFTIKKTGQGQVNFGSYPGAWTPALQIQNNDNTRYIWLSPLDNASGGNSRLVSGGANFDIMPGNVRAATFTSAGNVEVAGQLKISGGSPAAGRVLTSDASGLATWSSSAGGSDNLGNHTATTTLTMAGNNITRVNDIICDQNYGAGLVGVYSSTNYQNVFAMGTSYRLATNGTTPGNLYGLAWTHSNVGGQSISGLSHQLLVMENGSTKVALGSGIWTNYNLTLAPYGGITSVPTSYGSIGLNIARNSYYGVLFGQGTGNPNLMYDTGGNGGVYYENYGWAYYYLVGSRHMNINTSADLGATLGVAGNINASGNIVNTVPSQGTLGLTGDLPGYSVNTYPTLKTSGGYLYFSNSNQYSSYIAPGGTYVVASSRKKKENIETLDKDDILQKINDLEMTKWNYKCESPKIKHIGPFAEDFYDKFGLNGTSRSMISTTDPAGVALVGIQALSKKIEGITTTSSDFGSLVVTSSETWVNFSDGFTDNVKENTLPVITLTSNRPNVSMYISEKNTKGFKIKISSALPSGLVVDYIAMVHNDKELVRNNKTSFIAHVEDMNLGNESFPMAADPEQMEASKSGKAVVPAVKISAPVNMKLSPEQMNKFKMESEAKNKLLNMREAAPAPKN